MKKTSVFILIAAMLFCMLTGCSVGGMQGGNAGSIKVLMILSNEDTYREMVAQEAGKIAQEQGMQFDLVIGDGTSDAQVKTIKEGVSKGYDVIICNPADAATALQLEIAAGDIPMVFFNSCPEERLLKKGKYVYVGSNEQDAGKFQAEYVLDKLGSKQELNVMILQGEQEHSATNGRTTAVKNALKDSGKKINYIFSDYADWSREKAKNMFDIMLKTGREVDCVICNNDEMALGTIESCKENKIDLASLVILGVDATKDGCEAIENGELSFTGCQSAPGQGRACVEAARALASGEDMSKVEYATDNGLYVYVPFEPVTAQNVTQYK